MKACIVFCLAVTAAAKPPESTAGNVRILKYDTRNEDSGAFTYAFEQSDGTSAHVQGDLIKVDNNSEETALDIKGSYSFVIAGFIYTVNYVANQNGYQPKITRTLQLPDLDFRDVNARILASLLGNG